MTYVDRKAKVKIKKKSSVASVRERAIPAERSPFIGEGSANFYVVSVTDPYGSILVFLDQSCYYFFEGAPHEAEPTPFQTHCFSENLVEPETIEAVK
jgi:hypothetical protein